MRTDSPAHKTHTWPSREEWARVQRTPYADLFDDLGFSRWAGDYATPGEINAVVTELKELYADEGSKLRTAKLAAGPLIRQPGETKTAHIRRYFAMSETDRSRLFPVHTHEQRRQDINTAIKALRNDTLPAHRSWDGVEAILAPLEADGAPLTPPPAKPGVKKLKQRRSTTQHGSGNFNTALHVRECSRGAPSAASSQTCDLGAYAAGTKKVAP
jgi:hypothetical protein